MNAANHGEYHPVTSHEGSHVRNTQRATQSSIAHDVAVNQVVDCALDFPSLGWEMAQHRLCSDICVRQTDGLAAERKEESLTHTRVAPLMKHQRC